MKNKKENEKDKERKDNPSHNISPYTAKTITLTHVEMQIAPLRCSFSLSFSLPNKLNT